MREDFNGEQWVDDDGRPAGGVNYGFLAVVASRSEFYNSVGFRCDENDEALSHIYSALVGPQEEDGKA